MNRLEITTTVSRFTGPGAGFVALRGITPLDELGYILIARPILGRDRCDWRPVSVNSGTREGYGN